MSIDPQFLALMGNTVKVYAPTAVDAYGHHGYSATPVLIQCRVMPFTMEFQSENGEISASTGKAITAVVTAALTDKWKIEVPELSTASGYRRANIISVTTHYDEDGPHHQTIVYGNIGAESRIK